MICRCNPRKKDSLKVFGRSRDIIHWNKTNETYLGCLCKLFIFCLRLEFFGITFYYNILIDFKQSIWFVMLKSKTYNLLELWI